MTPQQIIAKWLEPRLSAFLPKPTDKNALRVAGELVELLEKDYVLVPIKELPGDGMPEPLLLRSNGLSNEAKAYFDGNGNVQVGGKAQWRIYWPNGDLNTDIVRYEGKTNNELEFSGLIHCLEQLINVAKNEPQDAKLTDVTIYGDSQLVVQGTNGAWRIKEDRLVPLKDRTQELLHKANNLFKSVVVKWCASAENKCDAHA